MEAELEVLLSQHLTPNAPGQATRDFIAGAAGGMAGVVAGQPLDTLRIRLQQRGCAARTVAGVWRGMAAAAEGSRALFRGMSYPLYTTALQNAVTFQAQRAGERTLAAGGAAPGLGATCAAGMFAGAVQTFISSPVELLKIRLQLQRAKPGEAGYTGPLAMLRRVLRDEGGAGLFRGCGVTMLRDVPSYGLYFVAYATLCSALDGALQRAAAGSGGSGTGSTCSSSDSGGGIDGSSGSVGTSGTVQFFAGGMAGMLAWLSVYPLDVVKSRVQAQPAAASPYRGAWHCARASAREEGLSVFRRGLGATLARAFIVNAAIFATFEAAAGAMERMAAQRAPSGAPRGATLAAEEPAAAAAAASAAGT